MPGGIAGTREVMRFLYEKISPDTYVNLMDQYYPAGKTDRYPRNPPGVSTKTSMSRLIERLARKASGGSTPEH